MAICRSCKEEIDFVDTKDGWKPVDPGCVYYDECEPGETLITETGKLYIIEDDRSFPRVKGYRLHYTSCTKNMVKRIR